MKKLFIILVIFFSLFPLSTGNTKELGQYINAYEWQEWRQIQKIGFVIGWLKCGLEAYRNLSFDFNKWDESDKFAYRTQENFKDAGILTGSLTIGQLIDIIDEIYSDPRVKTMDITEIMPLANGRLTRGWTAKELDEVIAINVKLNQCEKKEEEGRKYGVPFIEECASLRKEKRAYLEKLKKK